MADLRKNKTVARCIVTAGTIMAGLGIWASVVNNPGPSQSVSSAPIGTIAEMDPITGNETAGLIVPEAQASPVVVSEPSSPQPAPLQTSPPATISGLPDIVQSTVPATTVVSPTPLITTKPATTTVSPAPVQTTKPIPTTTQPKPVPTATPRIRTRGS